jgi:acetate---CoA ligase (ADP-forming)
VSRAAIDALLRPRSIAIVGASSDPTRIGGRSLRYYREFGFGGAVYPVNPGRPEVQGLRAYPDVRSVPEKFDLAIIALPAKQVAETLLACGERGARAAVIFSSGFSEIGEAAMQQEIAEAASRAGIRFVGPNCLGLFNASLQHFATFSGFPERGVLPPGNISLVTQSGAFGSHLLVLLRNRGIGVRTWVSTGNEADLTVADLIEYLADDPETGVIGCYAEGIRDGRRFMAALERARAAKKPVVLMKVGRSAVGAAAAASHTASLAGADEVADAAFRQAGAERAETTEEMLDILYAASNRRFPRGNKLGIVTISGGAGVLMADAAEKVGLDVSPMPDKERAELEALNPLASARNPVDVTAQALNDVSLVRKNVSEMLRSGGYDAVNAFFTSVGGSIVIGEKIRAELLAGMEGFPDRLLLISIIAPPDVQKFYEEAGFLVFEDPTRAVVATAALARFGRRFNEVREMPATLPDPPAIPRHRVDEVEAKRLLAQIGISSPEERRAKTSEEAAAAARELGTAVALKIVSPDVAHKTELGGVLLDVAPSRVAEAAQTLLAKPGVTGVLVSPMLKDGIEVILGARNDPVFGPIVMVGLGGIFVEILKDVAIRIAPIGPVEARRMLDELKGRPLLDRFRGRAALDVDALAEAIVRLSAWAAAATEEFESIEVNPLYVREKGVVALDALIVPKG